MFLLFILFVWLLCGVITASIAYSKNRLWVFWGILGCTIGIFGLIWISALPTLEPLEPEEPHNLDWQDRENFLR